MKWCRIALTRLSCETMHRLDQLTVHQLLRCEVIHHSSLKEGGGKLPGVVSPVAKTLVGGGGPTRCQGQLSPARP